MTQHAVRASTTSRCWRVLRWTGLAAAVPALWACTSRTFEAPVISPTGTLNTTVTQKINNNIDILFMIDDSSSMKTMQQKLAMQLPSFMQVLEGLPNGLPNVHIAVVSSDMGAPGDATDKISCTAQGNAGQFQYTPGAAATCTSTTLSSGATFISDIDGVKNFTDPIEDVFQCIAQLGQAGCGFEQQLASIDRALGADGAGAPSTNANFLRDDAYLGIVLLTNEDDCSAPRDTTIYSLNGGDQSITNPDGPLGNYRCNGGRRGGHLCKDPATGQMIVPPLTPPSDATGSPQVLNLTDCVDNDTGSSALIPVQKFVDHIKALKAFPDKQILVGAIAAPAAPYGIVWAHPDNPTSTQQGAEYWPSVMHSCGAQGASLVNPMADKPGPTDGSFGDPGVRIAQFVHSFPHNYLGSICDTNYNTSLVAISTALAQLLKPICISGSIQKDAQGQPACTVTNHLTNGDQTMDVLVPSCAQNNNVAPCWTMQDDATNCPDGGQLVKVTQDAAAMSATSVDATVECALCMPGTPGC
jgi:hypothetical protein